ncbi:MAG: YggT family protein [Treponema sp.]|nr:YggT family protein [Treponema sp.]
MTAIFGFLSSVLGIYTMLLVARIILTWFGNNQNNQRSGIVRFLSRVTDPYLDWWRNRFNFRVGFLDLTPIVAMAALHVLQGIFSTIATQGNISLGIILAIIISSVWSMLSFIIGFCIIVLVARLVGYFMNKEMIGPFWTIVDSISRPLLFRVTRLIFRDRIINFVTSIVISIALLVALWAVGGAVIRFLVGLLVRTLT